MKAINTTTGLSTRSYYYATEGGETDRWVKAWYDRSLKLWVSYLVDAPNDDGNQITGSQYSNAKGEVPMSAMYY